jgi:4-hydroxybenzoate polyprenyltransferase
MIINYLSLVKFSHTIFALPFALCGVFLGFSDIGQFDVWMLLKVVLCMVTARSAAMAFNRYLDRDIDVANPRTVIREIPSGIISAKGALTFTIINSLLFVLVTYFINDICFYLSPVALLIVLGYSYTKRFTSFCHMVLGLGLSLAPVGAYLAVTGHFGTVTLWMGAAVLAWVSGFDIIYALQDQEFDKTHSLNSIPVNLGTQKSIWLSRALHIISAMCLGVALWFAMGKYSSISWIAPFGLIVFVFMLVMQHVIVGRGDLSRINLAFFTTNGIASLIFGTFMIVDLLV